MRPFVLLIGPSGVGKSTLIKELIKNNPQFVYISPYMDRPLRPGEVDKHSISPEAFDEMVHEHKFVAVNHHFGHRYGTPKETIDTALKNNQIPILDMQLSGVQSLAAYDKFLLKIYIAPPSLSVLQQRLALESRTDRFETGKQEIEYLDANGYKNKDIHETIINDDLTQTVGRIRQLVTTYSR